MPKVVTFRDLVAVNHKPGSEPATYDLRAYDRRQVELGLAYCYRCSASLTETDLHAGACTQCGEPR